MSITPLRPVHVFQPGQPAAAPAIAPVVTLDTFAAALVSDALVTPDALAKAQNVHRAGGHHLFDGLLAADSIAADTLYDAVARHWSSRRVDLMAEPPDPRVLTGLDPVRCLREGWLPWRKFDDSLIIVASYPDRLARRPVPAPAGFASVLLAVAPYAEVEAALLTIFGPHLAFAAEHRVPALESCRNLHAAPLRRQALRLGAVLAAAAASAPQVALLGLFVLAIAAMLGSSLLKLAALWTMLRKPVVAPRPPVAVARLPMVSILVAMYRESNIAARLAARLGRLDYPPERLDILLVVEEEDTMTREALARATLPQNMRVVVVPRGSVKTKPRALNYALDHCRGTFVGVYDAEDAPEPQQIRKVVQRFHEVGPRVACLQGILDFYNPRKNWLSRCFTIEYASWFRGFLPALQDLGLALPLGGTTLFFRRDILLRLGGWDAQNVTEDADLGLRLARHGYRTELIDTVTFEEANCRALPWVKQRSRWIKGYMMTWLCHMRRPGDLWRELGPRQFAGVQLLFLGSILHGLLAPLIWSFWVIPFGLWHPVTAALPRTVLLGLYALMLGIQALTISFDLIGLRRSRQRVHPLWVPTLGLYHMLATLSAYKALWEMLTRPFYWDKTDHGRFGG